MNSKKGINFFFASILIITGSKLVQHFDFQNLKFEKPAIDTVYLISFVVIVFFVVRDFFKKKES